MIARLLTWLRSRMRRAAPDRVKAYERERKRLYRERRRAELLSGTCPGHVPDIPHREESKIQENKKTQAHFISQEWRPDNEGMRLGVQAFGADGVEVAIARHRHVWRSRPMRLTEEQWHEKWKAWCLQHIAPALPLVQLATARAKDSTPDTSAYIKPDSHPQQWKAWAIHRGKSLPTDKNGGWRVSTEWPPGWEEQKRESG
jgi:hypothetical protein